MNSFIKKKLFVFLIYLLSTSTVYSIEVPKFDNLIFHKETKKLGNNINFKDKTGVLINLSEYKNKLIILNFWATWCLPCKKEMPSLDNLQGNNNFKNLEVIPINVGRDSIKKSEKFYESIGIKNLKIFSDETNELANIFLLRGIPTSILINKDGQEFARVLGSIDFEDKKLVEWLKLFD